MLHLNTMIFSTWLPLTANQNLLKAAFHLIFWLRVWSCILLWGKLGRRFRRNKTRAPLLWAVLPCTHRRQPLPCLPCKGSSPPSGKKRIFFKSPYPFCCCTLCLPQTPLPVTHPSVSCRLFSYLQKVRFGNRDTFKKYSWSIQPALTLLLSQKSISTKMNGLQYANYFSSLTLPLMSQLSGVSPVPQSSLVVPPPSSCRGGQRAATGTTEIIQTQRYLCFLMFCRRPILTHF